MEFSSQEYWSGLPFPSRGIFLIQGSNPGLPHCRWILYRLSHNPVVPAAAAKSLQSRLTLSDPMDPSLPGSSVHGIFQARVLEWVAIAFFELNKQDDNIQP